MKLEHLQQLVTKLAIIGSGILVAVMLGQWAGRGDKAHITMLLGAIAYALLFLKMRQNIWLLIPLLLPLGGKLGFLPLPFSAAQLGIMIVFGSYLSLIALKIVQTRPKYDLLDLILLINILYSATVYVRNPVGTLAINSDRIGGKPYVDLIVGLIGYWTLCRVVATPKQLTKIPFFMFIGPTIVSGLGFIAAHVPFTGPTLSKFYSDISRGQDQDEAPVEVGGDEMNRQVYYAPFASSLSTMLISYFNPSTLINPFYLFRFTAFIFSVVTSLITGHRSLVMNAFAYFFISSLLRERFGGFCRMTFLVAIAFALLILGNGTFYNLPLSVQRALSFLPGNWNPDAKGSAIASTKWRQEMWKKAYGNSMFESTKYIKSKLLGDGPGFDKAELANFMLKGAGNEGQQEDLMIAGGFHSGPVSTLRNVGYVGGILFYILMFFTAFRAYEMITRTRGTEFFCTSLFVGIPMMWAPILFTAFFGDFNGSFSGTMISIGFLKMIDQSLTASHSIQPNSSKRPKAELRASGSIPAPVFSGRPIAGGVQTVGM